MFNLYIRGYFQGHCVWYSIQQPLLHAHVFKTVSLLKRYTHAHKNDVVFKIIKCFVAFVKI